MRSKVKSAGSGKEKKPFVKLFLNKYEIKKAASRKEVLQGINLSLFRPEGDLFFLTWREAPTPKNMVTLRLVYYDQDGTYFREERWYHTAPFMVNPSIVPTASNVILHFDGKNLGQVANFEWAFNLMHPDYFNLLCFDMFDEAPFLDIVLPPDFQVQDFPHYEVEFAPSPDCKGPGYSYFFMHPDSTVFRYLKQDSLVVVN